MSCKHDVECFLMGILYAMHSNLHQFTSNQSKINPITLVYNHDYPNNVTINVMNFKISYSLKPTVQWISPITRMNAVAIDCHVIFYAHACKVLGNDFNGYVYLHLWHIKIVPLFSCCYVSAITQITVGQFNETPSLPVRLTWDDSKDSQLRTDIYWAFLPCKAYTYTSQHTLHTYSSKFCLHKTMWQHKIT